MIRFIANCGYWRALANLKRKRPPTDVFVPKSSQTERTGLFKLVLNNARVANSNTCVLNGAVNSPGNGLEFLLSGYDIYLKQFLVDGFCYGSCIDFFW